MITEVSEPKFWMHINHCFSSSKAIPIQEVQKLLCVDAAASDAENLWRWCLAIFVDIFWEFLFKHLWNNSARLKQFTKQGFNNKKNSSFISTKSVAIRECWSRVIVIGYKTDNLKAETYSVLYYLRKSLVFELCFPSRMVSAQLCVAMTSWQIERVINKNYRILCRNLIVGINLYKLLILRKIMFSK